MSHEIYYTSAPEGLKRGSSGFSTVATTDNIPKPLWDRLESLSAYRHHFGVASEGTNSNPSGASNPTSFAHQLLSVTGTTYHVLSRICDAGVDHTQRSNAFAHHLVLDSSEMASAAGGPAWLLQQPGVLESAWNGNVGTIARKHLIPVGNTSGAVCSRWQSLTGDAGWGGALADLFVKSPAKPVCILFSPEQADILLPLLAETIALLPPATRWNVTFNTYFTSMPTSATCAWRCCLAGTPAAQTGLRYAANGIVIDLTDRSRLPALPPGDYVTYARTGIAPASAKPTLPLTAPTRPAPVKAPKIPVAAPTIATTPEEEAEEERREFELLDAAQRAASSESPPPARAEASTISTPPRRSSRKRSPSIIATDRAYLLAQTDAATAATRRRKQVMLLFAGALVAIALAMIIVAIALHTEGPTELPSLPRTANTVTPQSAPPPAIAPTTLPSPAPVAPSNTVIVKAPTTPAPVATAPTAPSSLAPSSPAVQVVPQFPTTLTLASSLDAPASPQGLADPVQSLAIPPRSFNASAKIASLRLRFPGAASDPPAVAEYLSQGVSTGKLTATPGRRLGLPTLTLSWKESEAPIDLLTLSLNANAARPTLDLAWKAASLVKRPDVISLAYWLLQNSTIDLLPQHAGDAPQQLLFKPLQLPAIKLADTPSATLALPAPLPPDVDVIAPAADALPEGWDATAYIEHEKPDPAHPGSSGSLVHVVKLHKATPVPAVDPLFVLRFSNNFTTLENGFPTGNTFATTGLEQAQSDLRAVETQIADATTASGGQLPNTDSTRLLRKRRIDLAATADAAKQALDAYNQFPHLTLPLALPDGTRLLTIPLTRDKP